MQHHRCPTFTPAVLLQSHTSSDDACVDVQETEESSPKQISGQRGQFQGKELVVVVVVVVVRVNLTVQLF